MDLVEKDNAYEVHADLPGIDEKDIEVKVANGVLTIKGQKEEAKEEEEGGLSSQGAPLWLLRARPGLPLGEGSGVRGPSLSRKANAIRPRVRARGPGVGDEFRRVAIEIEHEAVERDLPTKQGAYMCEADAKAAGDRTAKNEKHP